MWKSKQYQNIRCKNLNNIKTLDAKILTISKQKMQKSKPNQNIFNLKYRHNELLEMNKKIP